MEHHLTCRPSGNKMECYMNAELVLICMWHAEPLIAMDEPHGDSKLNVTPRGKLPLCFLRRVKPKQREHCARSGKQNNQGTSMGASHAKISHMTVWGILHTNVVHPYPFSDRCS
ncbi:hypothetical protein TNCV_3364201 [Trichonephila clavipes]|nr:hypothetical protein TNCV_3364201 [Trichonephila clavipes]